MEGRLLKVVMFCVIRMSVLVVNTEVVHNFPLALMS